MSPKVFVCFCGFAMLLVATYCPLLSPFGIVHWNLYDLNKPYGVLVLLVCVLGIAGVLLQQYSVSRIAAWLSLALVVLVYIAAIMKVRSSFTFIPMKGVATYLTRHVKFMWGWVLMFAGPLLSLFAAPRKPFNFDQAR